LLDGARGYTFDRWWLANDVVHATRLPFDPGSPAWESTSYVEGSWSPVRRGVTKNRRVKATRSYTRESPATIPGRTFLSQAGPQVGLEFFKLSITF
jgi:hypothetical protein